MIRRRLQLPKPLIKSSSDRTKIPFASTMEVVCSAQVQVQNKHNRWAKGMRGKNWLVRQSDRYQSVNAARTHVQ